MRVPGIRGELYFHILARDRRLHYGDNRLVEVGKELKARKMDPWYHQPYPVLCSFGMHGSARFIDAVGYRFPERGYWVCVVRIWGHLDIGNDKVCGDRRRVIAMRQVENNKEIRFLTHEDTTDRMVYEWVMRAS